MEHHCEKYNAKTKRIWVLAIGLLCVLGCGRGGPKTFPVKGNVQLVGADVKVLAGSHVEGVLTNDTNVRTSGVIQPDGSFTLGTLHRGSLVGGAREGKYQFRILLADDDPKNQQQATKVVAPKFLAFPTSGLTLDVPARDRVTFAISSR